MSMAQRSADIFTNRLSSWISEFINQVLNIILDLKCNYTESLNCRSSVLHLKFVNGWERKFFLRYADMDAINTQIEMYNHFIEGTRALQGHDDEPEDEIKTL